MWTYSASDLNTTWASVELAEILYPTDGSIEVPASLSQRLGLTAADFVNESALALLRLEWPEVIDRLLVTCLINRPEVPFYRLDELAEHLKAFRDYLESERHSLLATGTPARPFARSSWLHTGLSSLYPDVAAFEAIGKGDAVEIVRRETLDNKIAVVDFLARNLNDADDASTLEKAVHLAQGTRPPERMSELTSLDQAHLANQQSVETLGPEFSGGYDDVIALIAYCHKEATLATFHSAKLRLATLWPNDLNGRYIEMAATPRKQDLDAALDKLRGSIDGESNFYNKFSDKLLVSQTLLLHRINVVRDGAFVFQRRGGGWVIRWDGGPLAAVPDLIGMRYIHQLLSSPSGVIRAPVLYAVEHPGSSMLDQAELSAADSITDGEGLPTTDPQTLIQVDQRLREIKATLAKGDVGQAADLRREREALLQYRSQTRDRFGRPRRENALEERQRKSVTNAINYARDQIRRTCPQLADHLRTLATGAACEYKPRFRIPWEL